MEREWKGQVMLLLLAKSEAAAKVKKKQRKMEQELEEREWQQPVSSASESVEKKDSRQEINTM